MSEEFTALPVADALRRLLKGRNFLLFSTTTGKETKLTQIWISACGQMGNQPGLKLPSVPQQQTTPMPGSAPAPQSGEAVSEERAELDALPLETLLQVARLNQNPSVRIDAIGRLAGYIRDDSRVQVILSQMAQR